MNDDPIIDRHLRALVWRWAIALCIVSWTLAGVVLLRACA